MHYQINLLVNSLTIHLAVYVSANIMDNNLAIMKTILTKEMQKFTWSCCSYNTSFVNDMGLVT